MVAVKPRPRRRLHELTTLQRVGIMVAVAAVLVGAALASLPFAQAGRECSSPLIKAETRRTGTTSPGGEDLVGIYGRSSATRTCAIAGSRRRATGGAIAVTGSALGLTALVLFHRPEPTVTA